MSAAAAQTVNPNADVLKKGDASNMNINAARGLQDVLKSNLGPKGTLKMLVSGAGDIKLTKDGKVLLTEMQIQNPTACMIARIATAQDDTTGDGTTSAVLIVGEIMKQAERHLSDGVHPRLLCEGIEAAKGAVLQFLDSVRVAKDCTDRPLLLQIAQASLRTKMHVELADKFTEMVVDAVLCVRKPDAPIDLHMVEIMHMQHKSGMESRLVKGLVMDHGGRHPGMPKKLSKVRILTMNIDLEYQKSEVNSGFYYNSAEQREKMVAAERAYTDETVRKVIALKKQVCDGNDKGFVVITQKGIDPISLDMLCKEGIMGLRRAKRRNMERLVLACGGQCINSVEELSPEILGHAGEVYEYVLGEEKYTFVEKVVNPTSCTVLLKGSNDHTIAQLKDAVRDGLRAVKNVLIDKAVVPGAGAFEMALNKHLKENVTKMVEGRAKRGVEAFAEAMLVVPKTLAENSGYDPQDAIIDMQEEHDRGNVVGFDISIGEPFDPTMSGIYDNFLVKQQILHSAPIIATQLLCTDEVLRAGVNMRKR